MWGRESFGVPGEGEGSGPVRPRRLRWGGGRGGGEGGVGCRRRGPAAAPGGAGVASSVTGRQRRGFRAPRGWPRTGLASRRGWPVASCSPSCLACPPPPVQVPSASRRGGLKTLWGSPVRLGSGRSGPWGGGFPSPPDSAAPPHAPWGRGCCATPRSLRGRREGATRRPRRAVRVRVCPASLGVCVVGGRWEPPGRLWGCLSFAPRVGGGGRMPRRPNLSDLLGVWSRLSLTGRPEAPLRGNVLCQGGGCPSGGCPPLTIKNSYDS